MRPSHGLREALDRGEDFPEGRILGRMTEHPEHPPDQTEDAASALAPACDVATGCITCGDVAVPLTVLRLDEGRGLALCVDEGGSSETVEIDLVAPVALGDRLLVHAGTAIARLSEEALQ